MSRGPIALILMGCNEVKAFLIPIFTVPICPSSSFNIVKVLNAPRSVAVRSYASPSDAEPGEAA